MLTLGFANLSHFWLKEIDLKGQLISKNKFRCLQHYQNNIKSVKKMPYLNCQKIKKKFKKNSKFQLSRYISMEILNIKPLLNMSKFETPIHFSPLYIRLIVIAGPCRVEKYRRNNLNSSKLQFDIFKEMKNNNL